METPLLSPPPPVGPVRARHRLLEVSRRIAAIATLPTDDEVVRVRKTLLTFATLLAIFFSVVWIFANAAVGFTVPPLVPVAMLALSILMLVHFLVTKSPELISFVGLGGVLLTPAYVQWTRGGFANGSAAFLMGGVAPFAALLIQGARRARWWCAAFVALTLLLGVLDPTLARRVPPAPPAQIAFFFTANVCFLWLILFSFVHYFVRKREEEHERSEGLLLNILPKPVADRLKREPRVIADGFADATILFADLVDFTRFSARIPPDELVALLNRIFSAFDRLAERRGLEKIKTIGDAYMVVGGLPTPRSDHVEAVAELALEMRRELARVSADEGHRFQMRFGIHSGPVVAGVIGLKKFIYDLWGDTVNTASRMETYGLPGQIQVTRATYDRLKGRYAFRRRGLVRIKGKGEMVTYLLEGRRPTGQVHLS